jgi:malonyl CoA-acyl carrier protein transacylase
MVPGLGCRHVGMGADLFDQVGPAQELFLQGGERLGVDFRAVCLEGSSRKPLPSRLEAQAIYAVCSAYGAALRSRGREPACVVGHSLGTYAALHLAGAYDFATGLELVTRAEELMEAHIEEGSQALGVVIALPQEKLLHLLSAYSDVWLANENCPGQYVIGGVRAGVKELLEAALLAGAYKAKPVPAARAMHTPLLGEVQSQLAEFVAGMPLRTPEVPVIDVTNGDGLASPEAIRDYLSTFLVRPVLWERTVRGLLASGFGCFQEIGPAAVLTDMMPYIDKQVTARTASEALATAGEHTDASTPRGALVGQ